MQITISNQQTLIKIKNKPVKILLLFLTGKAEQNSPFPYHNVNILLVNDEKIKSYKLAFFDKNETTDVIAIPHSSTPASTLLSADIIISIETTLREAKKRNIAFEEEFALYLAHAIDHLTGATDSTTKKRNVMLKREKSWVAAARKKSLLKSLVYSK
jgi:rRNA maturation RNase YbeY